MKAKIVTFYAPQYDEGILRLQQANVQRHAGEVEHQIVRVDDSSALAGHWRNIDDVMLQASGYDVVLFLEYDAALLNKQAVPLLLSLAQQGVLAGCATCASHLAAKHVICGPCCTAVPVKRWQELGRPSAAINHFLDTMGQFTMAWRGAGYPVFLSMPVSCSQPIWELPLGYRFGPDTVYDIGVYHRFQSGQDALLRKYLATSS